MQQKDAYRIICLGESTTAGVGLQTWPGQLDRILNQKNIGVKFSVVNKGMIGVNTSFILGQIDNILNLYKPDMVISMMGVNDKGIKYYADITDSESQLFNKFRTYRLAKLLWKHIVEKIKEDRRCESNNKNVAYAVLPNEQIRGETKETVRFSPNNRIYYNLGNNYISQNKLLEAEKAFRKAIKLDPRDYESYTCLGHCYMWTEKLNKARATFHKALTINPKNDDAYANLGWCYENLRMWLHAGKMYEKAIEANPKNEWACFQLAAFYYFRQHKLFQAEDVLKKLIEINPLNDKAYANLGMIYKERGEQDLARKYYDMANKIRMEYYDPVTRSNYQRLKEILDKRKIKLVCVQYPMRNIELLRMMFAPEDRDSVIFVDNEKTFKEAVKKESYEKYFCDIFAGDFGHCTQKGYTLLAENIAEIILKECFSKER